MGDFNEVIVEEEKSGGNPIYPRRVNAILDCMDSCQIMIWIFWVPNLLGRIKERLGI